MSKVARVNSPKELTRELLKFNRDLIDSIEDTRDKSIPLVTQEIIRDSNRYVPFDTSDLGKSAIENSKLKKGEAIWKTPYARKVFYGITLNFRKDKNPNAQAFWTDPALRRNMKKYKKMFLKIFNREWK